MTGTPVSSSFAAALQVRIIDAGTSPWLDGYARAAAYHAEHGHLKVPQAYRTADGSPLGSWIQEQRQVRREGTLSADRKRRLDAIGMVWDPFELAWDNGLARLRAFKAVHGHLDIPHSYQDADGFALGAWAYRACGAGAAQEPCRGTG